MKGSIFIQTIDHMAHRSHGSVLMFSFKLRYKRGALGFWLFLDRFFSFCTRKLRVFGFGVHYGLQIFRF